MTQTAEMDVYAELVARREDAPFSQQPDTALFVPHEMGTTTSSHYETSRTGAEGMATPEEFVLAFGRSAYERAKAAQNELHAAGVSVAGMIGRDEVVVEGVVAGEPFWTIKRTPNMYVLPQTTAGPGEQRMPNRYSQAFNYYVGTLWLAVDYQGNEGTQRSHAALHSLSRQRGAPEVRHTAATTSLIFGEETIQKALFGLLRYKLV